MRVNDPALRSVGPCPESAGCRALRTDDAKTSASTAANRDSSIVRWCVGNSPSSR